MSLRIVLAAAVMAAGLSACKPTEIGPGADQGSRSDAEATARAGPPVKLPPAISASRQYRCSDNSLAFVDFYADDVSASLRTAKEGAATRLAAAAPGEDLKADGYSLKGSKAAERITITTPGHPKPFTCHV
jgi:hypothetical protein